MMDAHRYKTWAIAFLAVFAGLLLLLGGATAVIDPYFHYHKPLDGLSYPISIERYQNNGIVKNFDYDAIITGTSMTQNFKTSEFDQIFGVNSVKVPLSGAGWMEVGDNLAVAASHNSRLRTVLWGLDHNNLLLPYDWSPYEHDFYPWYLYDDNPLNDVSYLLNKTVLLGATKNVLTYTRAGRTTTSFDTYGNWMDRVTFGKEAILENYSRDSKADTQTTFSEEDKQTVKTRVERIVLSQAEQNPNIDYYCFFTPYSILYFDYLDQVGELELCLDAEKYAIELMLPYNNIHLFSFFTEYDMICNLSNYKDVFHYHEDVNSQMLQWMHDGVGELTKDNYEDYCAEMREFYLNYDYDALFT